MGLTNAGRNFIAQAVINDATPTFFTNANARIGVGDSSTAFAAAQTDLQAATNKVRVAMEGGFPTRTDNAIDFKAEFGTAVGNFAWQEWGVFNDASAGIMFNRKVENLGTKVEGSTWILTVTLTISLG
jgi:hypothetical protein